MKPIRDAGSHKATIKSIFALKPIAVEEEEVVVASWWTVATKGTTIIIDGYTDELEFFCVFKDQLYASLLQLKYLVILDPSDPDIFTRLYNEPDWTLFDLDGLLSDDDYLYAFLTHKITWKDKYIYRYDGTTWELLSQFEAGEYNKINEGIVEHNGFFYIGQGQQGSSSKLYPVQIWKVDKSDGTASLEFEVDGGDPAGMNDIISPAVYNGKLHALYRQGNGNVFSIYERNETTLVWSQVYTTNDLNMRLWDTVEYNGSLFFGGNVYKIWSFNGTTVVEYNLSLLVNINPPYQVYSFIVHEDKLYLAGWDGSIVSYNAEDGLWTVSYPNYQNTPADEEYTGYFEYFSDMIIFQNKLYATGDADDNAYFSEVAIRLDQVAESQKLLGYTPV
jgi:hypothetical protein